MSGKSFKCPPAPSETALLLHDYLVKRGRREATEITVVMPFGTPIPPSPDASQAILAAFAERGIRFLKDNLVRALDPARKVAMLTDGTELPFELFLGIPVHRVPQVVVDSGLAADAFNWVPVNKKTLETSFSASVCSWGCEWRRYAEGRRVCRRGSAGGCGGNYCAVRQRACGGGLSRPGLLLPGVWQR